MAKLTLEQVTAVKSMGFLRNRGTDNFSGRIVPEGSVFSAEDLMAVAELAKKYGNGKVAFTTRLTAEVVGIPYEQIEPAKKYAKEHGLNFGGTGAKIRPVTACKGTTCVYGQYDTQAMAKRLHEAFYIGWSDVKLPHKFKIAVGGCPNSCMKPSLNDFGIQGHRTPVYHKEECRACKICQVVKTCPVSSATQKDDGILELNQETCISCGACTGKCPFKAVEHHDHVQYQIFAGGTWGKQTRIGTPLKRLAEEEEIFPLLEKTLLWYRENAYQKERLGAAIDRLGVSAFENAIEGDELLERKEAILAADIKTK